MQIESSEIPPDNARASAECAKLLAKCAVNPAQTLQSLRTLFAEHHPSRPLRDAGAPCLVFETWVLSTSLAAILLTPATFAQDSIGSLKTEGAEITGLVSVSNGHATIGNNGAVTAGSQIAQIALKRGGDLRVCAGSAVHLSQTAVASRKPPLLVALQKGAMEIHTGAEKTDAILTPDLRFELSDAAPLDLRVRVVANGDTCVDNAGKDAPMLHVTETFGDGTYFIRPGQRVLFEHGSLREVVDHESSSCGCPRSDSLVLAGKGKKGDGKITEAAKSNPFPEAVSQGLQAPGPPQPVPAGETHVQVATTMKYDGAANTVTGPPGQTTTAAEAAAADTPASAATSQAPAPSATSAASQETSSTTAPADAEATDIHIASTAPPPSGPHPLSAIGRFFRRLFGVH